MSTGYRDRWLSIRRRVLRSGNLLAFKRRIETNERLLATLQAGSGVGWMLLFMLGPIVYVFVLSFWQSTAAGVLVQKFTLENYQSILLQDVRLATLEMNNLYLLIFRQSLKFGVIVTMVTLLFGYLPGYFVGRSKSRYKGLLLLLVVLPFWVPVIIRYYAWAIVIGNEGLIVTLLGWVGIASGGFLYNQWAVVTGLVQVFLPFMILPIYNSVNKIDDQLIESAKTMGAGPLRTFYEVTLPLSLPGISAGVILVFILTVGSYLAPAVLGGPEEIMIANLIGRTFSVNQDWTLASAMSIVYLFMLVVLISVFNHFVNLDEVFGEGGT